MSEKVDTILNIFRKIKHNISEIESIVKTTIEFEEDKNFKISNNFLENINRNISELKENVELILQQYNAGLILQQYIGSLLVKNEISKVPIETYWSGMSIQEAKNNEIVNFFKKFLGYKKYNSIRSRKKDVVILSIETISQLIPNGNRKKALNFFKEQYNSEYLPSEKDMSHRLKNIDKTFEDETDKDRVRIDKEKLDDFLDGIKELNDGVKNKDIAFSKDPGNIGLNTTYLRKRKDKQQFEIQKKITMVATIDSGKCPPNSPALKKYAEELEVPIEIFYMDHNLLRYLYICEDMQSYKEPPKKDPPKFSKLEIIYKAKYKQFKEKSLLKDIVSKEIRKDLEIQESLMLLYSYKIKMERIEKPFKIKINSREERILYCSIEMQKYIGEELRDISKNIDTDFQFQLDCWRKVKNYFEDTDKKEIVQNFRKRKNEMEVYKIILEFVEEYTNTYFKDCREEKDKDIKYIKQRIKKVLEINKELDLQNDEFNLKEIEKCIDMISNQLELEGYKIIMQTKEEEIEKLKDKYIMLYSLLQFMKDRNFSCINETDKDYSDLNI